MATYAALFNGRVIARSDRTVEVEGNRYFPPDEIRQEFLHPVRHKTLCPWKGIASYYTVDVDEARAPNAAWTYRHPSPLARRIRDHVAFAEQVEVREEL
jgi:uncharacterized protein (DUF427 family)